MLARTAPEAPPAGEAVEPPSPQPAQPYSERGANGAGKPKKRPGPKPKVLCNEEAERRRAVRRASQARWRERQKAKAAQEGTEASPGADPASPPDPPSPVDVAKPDGACPYPRSETAATWIDALSSHAEPAPAACAAPQLMANLPEAGKRDRDEPEAAVAVREAERPFWTPDVRGEDAATAPPCRRRRWASQAYERSLVFYG
jgi:hypothetical protein